MLRYLLTCLAALLPLTSVQAAAEKPVYVVLWFDTEDYIEPAADDSALRIATELSDLGVRATFKLVGEKARILQARGRMDVIRALSKHAIGYHSNYHSIPPAPAVYLRRLGFIEGAEEFERRETPGVESIRRIFGITPICYGQPGVSWAPQTNPALRRMGIPVYLDAGEHVGINDQPVWYGGLLYIFEMGPYQVRPDLDHPERNTEIFSQFDADVQKLQSNGGGVISTYFHPTEFVTTEFWDAMNFAKGADRERADWERPHLRTREASERCFAVLKSYVEHAKSIPGVRFVTAQDLLQLYQPPLPPKVEDKMIAEHLTREITFLHTGTADLSPADMLLQLLGMEPKIVDGPAERGITTYKGDTITAPAFARAQRDIISYINANQRLPKEVFIASDTLSLADFTATLAGRVLSSEPIRVRHASLATDRYFATDATGAFKWPIHPEGFSAPELLELARLQGWTLKPAMLR